MLIISTKRNSKRAPSTILKSTLSITSNHQRIVPPVEITAVKRSKTKTSPGQTTLQQSWEKCHFKKSQFFLVKQERK